MSRDAFHSLELDRLADADYRDGLREERAQPLRFPTVVQHTCPHCVEGRVTVADGTAFPGTVICHHCAGQGWFYAEAGAVL